MTKEILIMARLNLNRRIPVGFWESSRKKILKDRLFDLQCRLQWFKTFIEMSFIFIDHVISNNENISSEEKEFILKRKHIVEGWFHQKGFSMIENMIESIRTNKMTLTDQDILQSIQFLDDQAKFSMRMLVIKNKNPFHRIDALLTYLKELPFEMQDCLVMDLAQTKAVGKTHVFESLHWDLIQTGSKILQVQ